eukprot:3590876-Amphidinium_carterae.2
MEQHAWTHTHTNAYLINPGYQCYLNNGDKVTGAKCTSAMIDPGSAALWVAAGGPAILQACAFHRTIR